MTCHDCGAMNSKFLGFADSGNLRIVQFKCQECGCVYSVKTKAEIKVIKRGRLDKGASVSKHQENNSDVVHNCRQKSLQQFVAS